MTLYNLSLFQQRNHNVMEKNGFTGSGVFFKKKNAETLKF